MNEQNTIDLETDPALRVRRGPEGIESIAVRLAALTPRRKKVIDYLRWVVGGAAAIAAIQYAGPMVDGALWFWGVAAIAFAGGVTAGQFGLGQLFKRSTRVVFTPKAISYRCHWRRKVLDRRQPHAFSLEEPRQLRAEKEHLEYERWKAQIEGKAIRQKSYYDKSKILRLHFVGGFHDLLTIYDEVKAQQLLAKVVSIDAVMGGAARTGNGIALDPADEWRPQPGEFPAELK